MITSTPAPSAPRFARPVAAAVVLGVLVLAGWWWHQAYRDPRIRFLAPQGPAEWIVFPRPANFDAHAEVGLVTRFRQNWNLAARPPRATLTYRAAAEAVVTINGSILPAPSGTDRHDWKTPVSVDVTSLLSAGANEITIAVGNRSGPPALWAWIDEGGRALISDEHWAASAAGSVWCPAQRATEPFPRARDGTAQDFGDFGLAWRTRWPALLVLLAVSALLVVSWPRWRRFAAARFSRAGWSWLQDPARLVLAGAIAVWLALFWHNLDLLPREMGFDAPAHEAYIRYIMEHHALPLADEGSVMYNPPLYYLLGAGLLQGLSLSIDHPMAAEALRTLALAGGIAQLWLIAASLRLLFPDQLRLQAAGILLAAALPPQIYLSHYITNEWLVATLVTATIYLCLRVLQSPRATVRGCAAVGACLGAALLTKFTALLVAPWVLGAVAVKVWRQDERRVGDGWRTLGALMLACGAVCGWHYLRVWWHFGQPLVGAWDPASGLHWWQDQGYLTFSHFLNFGDALVRPAFSARSGFWDGLYSTLWGDGLCGGRATGDFRPPWDYALMTLGGGLAIGLTLALFVGAGRSLWLFLRQPTPERLILNGLGFGFAAAVVMMDSKVPCFGQLKAFYGLAALLPCCVFIAEAWTAASRVRPWMAGALGIFLGTWALTNFATYWIPPGAAQTQVLLGSEAEEAGQPERAAAFFSAAMKDDPENDVARTHLASVLEGLGRTGDARDLIGRNLEERPGSAIAQVQGAVVASAASQWPDALAHARRALELAPDCLPAHALLVQLLQQLQRGPELIAACRDSLRVEPANPRTHITLGLALAQTPGTEDEAREQLSLAARLAPTSVEILNAVAWMFATHASSRLRDGAQAVELAKKACDLARNRSAIPLLTLAAAQAETGRFEEASAAASQAEKLAADAGQAQLAAQCGHFAVWFASGHPFHQPAAAAAGEAPPK